MQRSIIDQLIAIGIPESTALPLSVVVGLAIAIIVGVVANAIARTIIVRTVERLVEKTKTTWDDALAERGVFTRFSHLAPAIAVWALAPSLLSEIPEWISVVRRFSEVYMLCVGVFAFSAFLDAAQDIYRQFDVSRRIPIRGYVQIVKLITFLAGGIFTLSLLLDKSPWVFLSGMGALTAIILLVFKDAILGFVAGIQLVANDMVRPGDWIAMPKYGADGDVLEISLTTVKVQNWDKTITTVPTYALISDAFVNWRGMEESGGRRIKRSISIDLESIRHCDDAMLDRFERIPRIAEYVRERRAEVARFNEERSIPSDVPVAGRRMTNVGTFRHYIEAYLRELPETHSEMTFLVRQLQPTDRGLPIEIYFFSKDQRWAHYEALQADIFDHLFASLEYFELHAFQLPSSRSVSRPDAPGGGWYTAPRDDRNST